MKRTTVKVDICAHESITVLFEHNGNADKDIIARDAKNQAITLYKSRHKNATCIHAEVESIYEKDAT